MLPYLCPEIIEWLLTWGAQPEDVLPSEEPSTEVNQDSSDNTTTAKQLPRSTENE
jgi:hypothetical protein